MRRITLALAFAVALAPATALAKPPANLHCPAGGTKVNGAGTHSVAGLSLVVSGSTVRISGPANAVVRLCVKASAGNTGIRTVTLDAYGEGVFQSDVVNAGGNIAAVSYTAVYPSVPDACPDKPGYQYPDDDCDSRGSGEYPVQTTASSDGSVDADLTSAFERDGGSITGTHLAAVALGVVALNLVTRRILTRTR